MESSKSQNQILDNAPLEAIGTTTSEGPSQSWRPKNSPRYSRQIIPSSKYISSKHTSETSPKTASRNHPPNYTQGQTRAFPQANPPEPPFGAFFSELLPWELPLSETLSRGYPRAASRASHRKFLKNLFKGYEFISFGILNPEIPEIRLLGVLLQ